MDPVLCRQLLDYYHDDIKKLEDYGGPQNLDNVLSSESPSMKGVNHEQQKKTV